MQRAIIVALWCIVLGILVTPAGAVTVLSERRAGKCTLSAMGKESFWGCGLATFNDRGTSLGLALLADGTGEISFRIRPGIFPKARYR